MCTYNTGQKYEYPPSRSLSWVRVRTRRGGRSVALKNGPHFSAKEFPSPATNEGGGSGGKGAGKKETRDDY